MRQVALEITRKGIGLLNMLDRGLLERVVETAGWELVRGIRELSGLTLGYELLEDLELWGWPSLNEASDPRAEIAILGTADRGA